jgi:hypothetical protein
MLNIQTVSSSFAIGTHQQVNKTTSPKKREMERAEKEDQNSGQRELMTPTTSRTV